MKLFLDQCKKSILNYVCGSSLTNTKIRNLIALHFIKSIRKKSIVGNNVTNSLSYDTMYMIYIPDAVYKKIRRELIMIVQATTREFEYILRTKVDKEKFPNYNQPHSPYWQFMFQPVPKGSQIPGSNVVVKDDSIAIESETFPEGRDQNTVDNDNQVRVSIRSQRSVGMNQTYFNKNAFIGINQVSEGEFVVPLGVSSTTQEQSVNRQSVLLTLSISNASFLVNGNKTKTYHMTTNELYVSGKNANDNYNGVRVLRIADNHIMNPQVHIKYVGGIISLDANGDVSCRNRKIGNTSVTITKGSSILINKTIQIVIS